LEKLRGVFLDRIKTLGEQELSRLLERVIPYIAIPSMRDVVMAVLAALPSLPLDYLRAIRKLPAVLATCPLSVQRQVWRIDRQLFADHTDALLAKHLPRCVGGHMREHHPPASRRADSPALTELAQALGDDTELTSDLMQRLRGRFAATGSRSLCAARSDVLMALYSAGSGDSASGNDPAFRVTWVLDACARTDTVTDLHASEVAAAAAAARGTVLVDIAMAAADPAVTHTLARAAVRLLHGVAGREALPADDPLLPTLLSLLELGGAARRLARETAPGRSVRAAAAAAMHPEVSVDVLHVLCPALVHLLVDASEPVITERAARLLSVRPALRRGGQPLQPQSCGRLLAQAVAAERVAAGDASAAAQLLGVLLPAEPHALQDDFLSAVVAGVVARQPMSVELENAVLSVFLVPAAAIALSAHRSLLRLLIALAPGPTPVHRLLSYATTAAETGVGEAPDLYTSLLELLQGRCAAEALAPLATRAAAGAPQADAGAAPAGEIELLDAEGAVDLPEPEPVLDEPEPAPIPKLRIRPPTAPVEPAPAVLPRLRIKAPAAPVAATFDDEEEEARRYLPGGRLTDDALDDMTVDGGGSATVAETENDEMDTA
jgi:hypothetical protein